MSVLENVGKGAEHPGKNEMKILGEEPKGICGEK